MIRFLEDQTEVDRAFRKWVDALIANRPAQNKGWNIPGADIIFTNYGWGKKTDSTAITNQVVLGSDPSFKNFYVKIVRPDAEHQGRGKLTAIGLDADGRTILLRASWLKRNDLSGEIRKEFSSLSGLTAVEQTEISTSTKHQWFVVADLSAKRDEIVRQTVSFARACGKARGFKENREQEANQAPSQGYDLAFGERGQIIKVNRLASSAEVVKLQGYVWEEIERRIGKGKLRKRAQYGFSVDGIIDQAKMLIEIKTGSFPQPIYEAIGQLKLYPTLVGLESGFEAIVLLPDMTPIKPIMKSAIENIGVSIYTYGFEQKGKSVKVLLSPAFLERCHSTSPADLP